MKEKIFAVALRSDKLPSDMKKEFTTNNRRIGPISSSIC
jgi:hypothetical protein